MFSHEDFYRWEGPRPEVTIGELTLRSPTFYHDSDVFMALHTASYDAVAAELPSDVLRPVRWVDGHAVVGVAAMRYHATTCARSDGSTHTFHPYGEILIGAMVTTGSSARALPLLRRRISAFVLHLPVTTREARDGGRQIYGLPKFVADMDFVEHPNRRSVTVSEGGATVLTLTVRPGGPVLPDRGELVLYSVLHGQLIETVTPTLGHRQARFGGRDCELTLGDHEVADSLRRLELSRAPVMAVSYLDSRAILPVGRPIGTARGYDGYLGVDRDFGRFTVSYPGAPPFDQYEGASAPQPTAVPVLR